jgi:hypothetical protein
MALKSYNTIPPGGWRYEQPETKWKLKNMGSVNDAVGEMLEQRRFNNLPRATRQECLEDLDAYTCQRLGGDLAWCVDGDAQKKTSSWPQPPVANPAGAGSLLQSAVNGTLILKDWLGEGGKPVSTELAQARANACLNDCSDPTRYQHFHNKPPSFFHRVTGAVAKAILEQRREKTNLGLKVDGEDKLFTCDICTCHLPLKVWVPMDVIMRRTEPEQLKIFPPWCWMVTENRRKNESLETNAVKTEEEK